MEGVEKSESGGAEDRGELSELELEEISIAVCWRWAEQKEILSH